MSNANQFRHNGRFARKSIINWKNNVSKSVKRLNEEYKNLGVQLSTRQRIVDLEKLAAEMWCTTSILDGGIEETQLNTILSALNLPPVDHNLIKWYERLVGSAIETVAKENCHEALKVEQELKILNEG
ncbi:hypothetical protein KQX54_009661 [Cotesia glomerata]|uniref:Mutator-like transposase domain-containing protein n=1 Tax=Cotesia glomerata TaxID=32391 RepID=A0AAV7IFV2_COTGL|nr:hypothetical protein KQX54_009661 [Cotesia glomerata]